MVHSKCALGDGFDVVRSEGCAAAKREWAGAATAGAVERLSILEIKLLHRRLTVMVFDQMRLTDVLYTKRTEPDMVTPGCLNGETCGIT